MEKEVTELFYMQLYKFLKIPKILKPQLRIENSNLLVFCVRIGTSTSKWRILDYDFSR